jgi:hypothetical protein
MNEVESKKYLALQMFYLEVRLATEDLEKKLKVKPSEKSQVELLEHQGKTDA